MNHIPFMYHISFRKNKNLKGITHCVFFLQNLISLNKMRLEANKVTVNYDQIRGEQM